MDSYGIAPIFQQVIELISIGGPVAWLLLVMSVVALTIFIAKWFQFIANGLYRLGSIDAPMKQWRNGEQQQALSAVQSIGDGPLPDMVSTAMAGQLHPKVTEHEAREAAARIAADHLDRLRPGLRTLEFIAATAPLMGLLGTVLGMIDAFKALQAAGNKVDPSILSGGIWAALVTTAAGLVVAIPTLMLLTILERRMERLHHKLQSATTQVFTVNADLARLGALSTSDDEATRVT